MDGQMLNKEQYTVVQENYTIEDHEFIDYDVISHHNTYQEAIEYAAGCILTSDELGEFFSIVEPGKDFEPRFAK
jgi:hypothetical protein